MNIIATYPIDIKWKPQTSGCSLTLFTALFGMFVLASIPILVNIMGGVGVLFLYGGIAGLLIGMSIWKERRLKRKIAAEKWHLQFENEGLRLMSSSVNHFFRYNKQLKNLSFHQYEYDDGSDKKLKRMVVKWETLENDAYEYALDILPNKLESVISHLLTSYINFSMYDENGNFTDFLNPENQGDRRLDIDKNILTLIDEIGKKEEDKN